MVSLTFWISKSLVGLWLRHSSIYSTPQLWQLNLFPSTFQCSQNSKFSPSTKFWSTSQTKGTTSIVNSMFSILKICQHRLLTCNFVISNIKRNSTLPHRYICFLNILDEYLFECMNMKIHTNSNDIWGGQMSEIVIYNWIIISCRHQF